MTFKYLSFAKIEGDSLVLIQQDYPEKSMRLHERVMKIPLGRCTVEEIATKLWERHRREAQRTADCEKVLKGE